MTDSDFLATVRTRTERALERVLPTPDDTPLPAAMRYATLGGGKRLRAALVHAAGALGGAGAEALDAPACAVELLHAYSLVHDDLPAMDDAPLRRGRPSCHVAFGEAVAVLAGDALQALAFEVLAGAPDAAPAVRAEMVLTLAQAAGGAGMAGGQMRDLTLAEVPADGAYLEAVSRAKTGALLRASVALGAAVAQAPAALRAALDAYADALGLAFQIRDDVLDVCGTPAVTGKVPGVDARHARPTFAAVLGTDGAQALARGHAARAHAALAGIPAGPARAALLALADHAVTRDA